MNSDAKVVLFSEAGTFLDRKIDISGGQKGQKLIFLT
jgi:hypothetical protein